MDSPFGNRMQYSSWPVAYTHTERLCHGINTFFWGSNVQYLVWCAHRLWQNDVVKLQETSLTLRSLLLYKKAVLFFQQIFTHFFWGPLQPANWLQTWDHAPTCNCFWASAKTYCDSFRIEHKLRPSSPTKLECPPWTNRKHGHHQLKIKTHKL